MAIIRNERSRRTEPEPHNAPEVEEEIDYSWHPSEDEFSSPLSAEQWAELLSDPTFADTDAARAVVCLRDYGEPATFQQLSIRYRGTMGRYRRWLSEAAQAAAERFDVPAPQKDQYGMDEWWPLLYLTRTTGKPGAGVFEMTLRPEVEEAFEVLAEQERQAKRAENARNLKRIEQLERARKEERERKAAEVAAETKAQQAPVAQEPAESPEVAPSPREETLASEAATQPPSPAHTIPTASVPDQADGQAASTLKQALPALKAFLELDDDTTATATRFVSAGDKLPTAALDVAAPLDYALRYAERMRYALALMREGNPSLTAATVARTVGEESVEALQSVLNGQAIPSFDLLDRMSKNLFVNVERLEAPDGMEEPLPAFSTLHEVLGTDGIVERLLASTPEQIAYVVDDAPQRRTGVVVRFSASSCALLTRREVDGADKRSDSPRLDAFIRMVDELDDFARAHNVARTSHQVHDSDWDALASGSVWPGTLLSNRG